MHENNAAKLLYRIRRERGILRILKPERLVCALEAPCADLELRTRLVSELTIRAWLLGGGGPLEEAERHLLRRGWDAYGLPERTVGCLEKWLGDQARQRRYRLPERWEREAEEPFRTRLADDLRDWESADGVICLLGTDLEQEIADSICLPYILDPQGGRHLKEVRTADDEPLPDLCSGVQRASRAARAMNLLGDREHPCVILHSIRGRCDVPFEGGSAGLALLVRHWMNKERIGAYLPLDVAASGCLTLNGDLDPDAVDTEGIGAKARHLRRIGANPILLPSCESSEQGVVYLPCGQPLSPYFAQHLKPPAAREEPAPRTRVTAANIGESLLKVGDGMRYGGMPAAEAKTRIEELLAVLSNSTGIRARRLWVQASALLASAECHLGNMDASAAICDRLLACRTEIGPRFTAHTLVLQAVNLTDMAEYARSVALCDDALALAAELSDPVERLDMEMQALGTQGQALMYWGLIDARHVPTARLSLDEARRRASQLDTDDPENQEKDLPRQLNYRYLWHALFQPEESQHAFEEARAHAQGDHHSGDFLQRTRWLAAYRAFLAKREFDWKIFAGELPRENAAGGWLSALSRKYRGTVRCAVGDLDGGQADFESAARPMEMEKEAPLLAFLGATAALQAGESLAHLDADAAGQHLRNAAELFARRNDWFRTHPEICGAAWLRRTEGLLRGEAPESLPNPQKHYPY